MKDFIKKISMFLIITIISYLLFTLFNFNFNPTKWDDGSRTIFILVEGVSFFCIGLSYFNE